MNISITARHFDLSESIKIHTQSALESLEKYNLDIISAGVVITQEQHKRVEYEVEFTINVAKHDTFVVKKLDKEAHSAIDSAIQSIQKTLRRYHDKLTDHHKEKVIIDESEED
jgi:putative sigma-54 modulation protein